MPLLIYVWYNFTNPLICTSALNYNWCAESDTSFRGFDLLSEKELLKRTLILSWKRQFRINFDYSKYKYCFLVCLLSSAISEVRIQFWQRKSAKETHQKMWVSDDWAQKSIYELSGPALQDITMTWMAVKFVDMSTSERESVFGSKSLSTFISYSKPLTDSLIESHFQVCKKVYMRAFIKRSPNFKNSLKTYLMLYPRCIVAKT